jgi:HK97 family phage prohead protease
MTAPKVYTFRANDGLPDRYGDRNSVKGWKLANYNANPVILFNHDDATTPGTERNLPIGRGFAYVRDDALLVDITFDHSDPFAQAVERKVDAGILNAVSVRYRLTAGKYRQNELGGIDSDEQELLEISIVTIPGNQRAVRVKSFDGAVETRSFIARRVLPQAPAQFDRAAFVADVSQRFRKQLAAEIARDAAAQAIAELIRSAPTHAGPEEK